MHRSGPMIMGKLMALVNSLIYILIFTIIMGCLGYLAAIGITVLGILGLLNILRIETGFILNSLNSILIALGVLAVSRGILKYIEQYTGHYVAFRLLAFIRDRVFKALRRLAPGKLENKDSGKLIALITSDIELLEVFFAHTISPIVIAVLTCCTMLYIISRYSIILAVIALSAYIIIGILIPWIRGKNSRQIGRDYREAVGDMNQHFLESLQGMQEIILFQYGSKRQDEIRNKTHQSEKSVKKLKGYEGKTDAITEMAILVSSAAMLLTGLLMFKNNMITFSGFLMVLFCLMSSYGPVVALSSLSLNLLQTLAGGERVLDLLEEKELVSEISGGQNVDKYNIHLSTLNFKYRTEKVLDHITLDIKENQITGICGKSGSGKSTLLKLIMRFYDADSGNIRIGDIPIKAINTESLRKSMAYVTQSTYLFHDTIEKNIRIAKRDAAFEEIVAAAKKANIHDFIMSLEDGYQTKADQWGTNFSGGERQRIGMARAFLHDAKIILLDEPTSNIDSLNESILLNSLKEQSENKTIIIVSHRESTLSIADVVYNMDKGVCMS
ncbi:MAG: ABC transporter ATP-binding protein/permease [Clostridia bacterium]|nr:ABC transporter ATP-binding protein/permease [Clostridia bacterium]